MKILLKNIRVQTYAYHKYSFINIANKSFIEY